MVLNSGSGKVGYLLLGFCPAVLCLLLVRKLLLGGKKFSPKDFADKIGSDMGWKGAGVEKNKNIQRPRFAPPSVRPEQTIETKGWNPKRKF